MSQVGADRARRIRFVRENRGGCRSGSADRTRDPDPRHHVRECRCVISLAGVIYEGQRAASAAGRQVDLRCQPTTRPPRCMMVGFLDRGLFTGPGRVLVSTNDRGVHRDDPVQIALRISLGEEVRAIDPRVLHEGTPRADHGRPGTRSSRSDRLVQGTRRKLPGGRRHRSASGDRCGPTRRRTSPPWPPPRRDRTCCRTPRPVERPVRERRREGQWPWPSSVNASGLPLGAAAAQGVPLRTADTEDATRPACPLPHRMRREPRASTPLVPRRRSSQACTWCRGANRRGAAFRVGGKPRPTCLRPENGRVLRVHVRRSPGRGEILRPRSSTRERRNRPSCDSSRSAAPDCTAMTSADAGFRH